MDVTADLAAPCPPERLFAEVGDLSAYPAWLTIVPRAEPADADDGDPGPAWSVELRGRLGPLARSKRLRMVRTELVDGQRVRFERRELDGRQHSPWVLEAEVTPVAAPADAPGGAVGSRLEMHLHYGGSFGGSLLERMLDDEITRSRPALLARVAPVEEGPTGQA